MLAITVPLDLERRLEVIAALTGRDSTAFALDAIAAQVDDFELLKLAEQRMAKVRSGESKTYSVEEVERSLGLVD